MLMQVAALSMFPNGPGSQKAAVVAPAPNTAQQTGNTQFQSTGGSTSGQQQQPQQQQQQPQQQQQQQQQPSASTAQVAQTGNPNPNMPPRPPQPTASECLCCRCKTRTICRLVWHRSLHALVSIAASKGISMT